MISLCTGKIALIIMITISNKKVVTSKCIFAEHFERPKKHVNVFSVSHSLQKIKLNYKIYFYRNTN